MVSAAKSVSITGGWRFLLMRTIFLSAIVGQSNRKRMPCQLARKWISTMRSRHEDFVPYRGCGENVVGYRVMKHRRDAYR